MDNLKLCESDYRFMTVIWDHEPLASRRLVELCAEKLGWTLEELMDKTIQAMCSCEDSVNDAMAAL